LTIGPLSVPDEYFVHFFRGCIDNTFNEAEYVYIRLFVSIVSASPRVSWSGCGQRFGDWSAWEAALP